MLKLESNSKMLPRIETRHYAAFFLFRYILARSFIRSSHLSFYIGRWRAWCQQHHDLLSRLSIHIQRTEAQSWRSLGLTSVSLLVIQGKARATASKHDTPLKCSDCMSLSLLAHPNRLIFI